MLSWVFKRIGSLPILVLLLELDSLQEVMFASAQTQCSNQAVPGADKMAHGIDVTSFDLFSTDSVGQKRRVFDYTCNNGRTRIIQGITYDVPDQMEGVTDMPSGEKRSVTRMITTYTKARQFVAENFGAKGIIKMFGFSASRSLKSMHASIVNQSRYIERVSDLETARTISMNPDFALRPGRFFQLYVDDYLPLQYQPSTDPSAPDPYRTLIGHYGTHYFQKANFGGLILAEFLTSSDYFMEKGEKTVERQAKASFANIINVLNGGSSSSTLVDESFTAMTTSTTRYFGGTTNLLTSQGIQAWQPTVSRQPWLLSGQLAPLSALIRNGTKRASMERAVTDYVLRAYLDELSRLLHGRLLIWSVEGSRLRQLETRVQTLKEDYNRLTEQAVTTLSDAVLEQVLIPHWFNERTDLCYEWYADGDGQCSAPRSPLCASPGQMTQEYRDDTDSRRGGCRMSWSLKSRGHSPWFNNVKVCFRWYPDGNGGQCGGGGGVTREMCAPVNSRTPYYRDDTDSRSGGCMMSWKLEVPETAPAWALNMQLCYVWRPDGDGGQCGGGGGLSRRLCAVANSWTRYYRDDTDRRAGGCRQSWGIHIPLAL